MTDKTLSRIEKTFARLQANQQKALVPFVTTGDPVGVDVADILHGLVAGGADIIELGIPFSDPAADGETIQKASQRAISHGVGYQDTFSAVAAFREKDKDTPIVLMGYLNPAEVHPQKFSGFAQAASESGADAVILVDLSYESGKDYRKALKQANVDLITLVAPTTSKTRLGKMLKSASGFVYYVSMRGVTGNSGAGQSALDAQEIDKRIKNIREKTDLPVCVGFGISDAETAKQMAEIADGVVVGSALVKKLYNAANNNEDVVAEGRAFMAELRAALDTIKSTIK